MSKSGKLKKAAKSQVEKEKNKAKQGKRDNSVQIFVGIAIAVGIIVAALVTWDRYHRDVAMTVGNNKIYKDELMYYVYNSESDAAFMDNFYRQIYGNGYWETVEDSGMTNSEVEKLDIKDRAAQDLILEKEAVNSGMSLTDEETAAADETAKTMFEQMSAADRKNNGVTLERLTKISRRIALGEKFKEHQKEGYDIDDEAIRSEVDKDEYRQYNIQYYSVSYLNTDDENSEEPLSDEKIKELEDKLLDLKKRAESGEDFETLIGEDEESNITFSGVEAEKVWKADTNFSDTVTSVIYSLEDDKISDVVKDEDSGELYLIKMLDNNSDEAYEDEVDRRISAKEDESFTNEYIQKFLTGYIIKYKDSVWDKIDLGSTFTSTQ